MLKVCSCVTGNEFHCIINTFGPLGENRKDEGGKKNLAKLLKEDFFILFYYYLKNSN